MLSVEYLIFIYPQLLDSIFWVWIEAALYGNYNFSLILKVAFYQLIHNFI